MFSKKGICKQKVQNQGKSKIKHGVIGCGNTQFILPNNAKPAFSVLVESSKN